MLRLEKLLRKLDRLKGKCEAHVKPWETLAAWRRKHRFRRIFFGWLVARLLFRMDGRCRSVATNINTLTNVIGEATLFTRSRRKLDPVEYQRLLRHIYNNLEESTLKAHLPEDFRFKILQTAWNAVECAAEIYMNVWLSHCKEVGL